MQKVLFSVFHHIIYQMDELREKLESKKMYREEMEENEKLLYEGFTEALGENNKFADFLTKVFKKKIKRVKKSAEVEGGKTFFEAFFIGDLILLKTVLQILNLAIFLLS